MQPFVHSILLIASKDLRSELRRPVSFLSTIVFCLLMVFLFGWMQMLAPFEATSQFPVFVWVILLFASLFGTAQTFAAEVENDSLTALLLAVPETSCILLGKLLANTVVLTAISLVTVPLAFVFWDAPGPERMHVFALAIWLGVAGLSSLGTLLSSVAEQAGGLAVLLPVFMLPLSLPLVIAVVELSHAGMGATGGLQPWLYLALVCDLLFLSLNLLLAGVLLEV